ncbi:30S ribosomal protein S14 [Streptomyces dengpaensis]|uniref:30S ribosomal protein S14 n=1 Tax=Streptomyces dengpaensis TaxID=2049881 RepID=A0ABM6T293_9ACTN|nr:30S ribosomal protein S14 [Streptomyces dengpaensis]
MVQRIGAGLDGLTPAVLDRCRTGRRPGGIAQQPRDASATRVRNRDSVDGRPRGYLRAFGLSRVNLREQAHAGFLPGVRKSSW